MASSHWVPDPVMTKQGLLQGTGTKYGTWLVTLHSEGLLPTEPLAISRNLLVAGTISPEPSV